MPVYRYLSVGANITAIARLIPNACSLGAAGPNLYVDITATAGAKADLDEVMASFGWSYLSTDPTETAIMASRASGRLQKNVAAGGTFVLTPTEAASRFIVLTGTLLGDVIVDFPGLDGVDWVVRNDTVLGLFSVTLRAVGSGVNLVLPVGTRHVWCNGTDLLPIAPLTT